MKSFRPDWTREQGNQLALAFECGSPARGRRGLRARHRRPASTARRSRGTRSGASATRSCRIRTACRSTSTPPSDPPRHRLLHFSTPFSPAWRNGRDAPIFCEVSPHEHALREGENAAAADRHARSRRLCPASRCSPSSSARRTASPSSSTTPTASTTRSAAASPTCCATICREYGDRRLLARARAPAAQARALPERRRPRGRRPRRTASKRLRGEVVSAGERTVTIQTRGDASRDSVRPDRAGQPDLQRRSELEPEAPMSQEIIEAVRTIEREKGIEPRPARQRARGRAARRVQEDPGRRAPRRRGARRRG